MTEDLKRHLTLTRRFDAAPERVFDAWLDPDKARHWLYTAPGDEAWTGEIDGRVGGRYRITVRREGTDYTVIGEYLEIERPRRLVFTFCMPQFSTPVDRVVVEIEPDGEGCVLTLTHENVPAGDHTETREGWGTMFGLLATLLAQPPRD
jgi:uncharacterized protein YndB with AHSA1/START domain